ncbi:hypothetical protein ACLOJK_000875, partial [Asimina triloba]
RDALELNLSVHSTCGLCVKKKLLFSVASLSSLSAASAAAALCSVYVFIQLSDNHQKAMFQLSLQLPENSSSCKFYRLCPSLCLHLLLFLSFISCHHACTEVERDSLVSFLLDVSSSPPLNWPSSNGSTASADCCTWEGITCDFNGSVTHLRLPQRGLQGSISSSLSRLASLSQLNLSLNSLIGTIPAGLLFHPHLQILDLSFNRLSGECPTSPNNQTKLNLQIINVSSNSLTGTFPAINLAPSLTAVNARNNGFWGPLPSVCTNSNSSSVNLLDFSSNKFNGNIPPGFGACPKLEVFRAGFNHLSGQLPADLFNAVSLQCISLPFNSLSGRLDGEQLVQLTNLTVLELNNNEFSGELPWTIGKLANLEQLLLFSNNLSGSLPPSLTNCTKLKSLNLRGNFLNGELSTVNFSSLAQLSTLDLGNNFFKGSLPISLYHCRSLTALRLAKNSLEGEIHPDMQHLQSLSYLSLSNNWFRNIRGALQILTGCRNLTAVLLSKNFVGETIPDYPDVDSEGLHNLNALSLADCQLTGGIPTWLASLRKLVVLDLSLNRLAGSIPSWLGSLPNLFYVDLSSNLLSGELPLELMSLPTLASQRTAALLNPSYLELPVFVKPHHNASSLQYNQLSDLPPAIYLKNNSLDGVIPSEIGHLQVLLVLDLSYNNFSGEIPDDLSNLTNLERLDLSHNSLSGTIPPSLKNLHFLALFSVAGNDLEGPIPTGGQFDTFPNSSFEGNPGLCGLLPMRACDNQHPLPSPAKYHGNKKLLFVGVILSICFGGGFVIATMTALWMLLSNRRVNPGGGDGDEDGNKMDISFDNIISSSNSIPAHDNIIKDSHLLMLFPANTETACDKDLTISDIMIATNNFDQANIIGCGGFGLVYKATLADGTKLAVKRLSGDLGMMEREFEAEVEVLSRAQHQNLVSLQGYSMHKSFRLLIYAYMENGSLDYWLHEQVDGRSRLDWPTRLKIVQGASRGLCYMHQVCEPHIVHRDIKSSNILLDADFEAHVADFGLSRLILPYNTHVTTQLVGTLGYIPPEYGQAWVATLRGDVYSFGVVMLELLAGRRPIEVSKPKMSRELVGWAKQMKSQGKQDQVFDPTLREKGFEDQLLQKAYNQGRGRLAAQDIVKVACSTALVFPSKGLTNATRTTANCLIGVFTESHTRHRNNRKTKEKRIVYRANLYESAIAKEKNDQSITDGQYQEWATTILAMREDLAIDVLGNWWWVRRFGIGRKMQSLTRLTIFLCCVWAISLLYGEMLAFWIPRWSCSWPSSSMSSSKSGKQGPGNQAKIAVIADPQLTDRTSLGLAPKSRALEAVQFYTDLYMTRSFRLDYVVVSAATGTAYVFQVLHIHCPDRWQESLRRFKHIFGLNQEGNDVKIKVHYLVGNHDIGYAGFHSLHPQVISRYEKEFGPRNFRFTVARVEFIAVDAQTLDGHPQSNLTLATWQFVENVSAADRAFRYCESVMSNNQNAHADAYANYIGEETSARLLDMIRPMLVLSGHDHDQCTVVHTTPAGPVKEHTLGTLSWQQGNLYPSFMLMTAAAVGSLNTTDPEDAVYLTLFVVTLLMVLLWPTSGLGCWDQFCSLLKSIGGGIVSNFKAGSKEKDEDDNCEFEMVWDAEGTMHLVKKASKVTVSSSSDMGLTGRGGAVVRPAAKKHAAQESEASYALEMNAEVKPDDGGKVTRVQKSKARMAIQRIFRMLRLLTIIATVNVPLYMMLLFKDWIDQ